MIGVLSGILDEFNVPYAKNVFGSTVSTYKAGGNIMLMILPKTAEDITKLGAILGQKDQKYCLLGKGSNTLIADGDVRIPMVSTSYLKGLEILGDEVLAFCGESVNNVALATEKFDLSCMIELFGIPGSIGGAIFMNAGAFGKDMSDFVSYVTIYDIITNEFDTINGKDIPWGYRTTNGYFDGKIIVSAGLKCIPLAKAENAAKRKSIADIRRKSQPTLPSLGSVFKRPSGDTSAGYYIDMAGLKGTTFGGAAISDVHAGFIVNTGGGTSSDYLHLMNLAKTTVRLKFGIELQPEICILGDI